MVHTLRLDNYSPTPRKLVLGTNSSFGTESIKIERGAGWDGLNLTATWHIPGREEPLRVALLDGDAMDVPPEVTKEAKDGVLVLAGLASGVQRASCNVDYLILEQAGVYGGADAEPTPELAAQVLEAALQAKADAEAAAEEAAAAKARAEEAQAASAAAKEAAEAAAADAAKAGPYAEAALAAQRAAEAALDKAITAQQAAENAAAAAAASKSEADTLAAEAARAALAAEESKATANAAANLAGENATAAQQAAENAAAAANYAGQSASDAAASKAAAEIAAQAAQEAQAAAAAARDDAVKAQTAAQTAAKTAQDAQNAAEKARDDAQTAQQGAEAARDAAAGSAEAAAKSEENAKQSANTLAESVENVAANTAAVAELKQQVANITPDDSTIGDKPWSSKHIIDMLFPPLEESGNPVVCYPVAGYPLGVKASWEPMQEGSGTPSPENIRPIKGRDSVRVERCGENLLDEARFPIIKTQNNIKTTSEITLPAGTYTVCVLSTASGVYARGADVDHTYDSNKHTFTLARQTAITLDSYWSKGRPENDENIWLVEGNEWRPYTPYIGQTNTLTLPETVYGGEVDTVTGEGQETWKSVSLDGTENWRTWGVNKNNTNVTGFFTYDINDYSNDASDTNKILCSTMSNEEKDIWGGKNMGVGLASSGRSKYLIYCVTTNTLPDTTDDKKAMASFKTFLANLYAAGTPVQVAYKLATQTPFTATGAQPIPALAGANTILTDADSATVTGRADPIKHIEDLEAAVASIN